MSKSWGHTLELLSDEEIARRDACTAREKERFPNLAWDYMRCRMGRCRNRAKYFLRYHYVTGRQGRVSWAEKLICESHADKYKNLAEKTNGRPGKVQTGAPARGDSLG